MKAELEDKFKTDSTRKKIEEYSGEDIDNAKSELDSKENISCSDKKFDIEIYDVKNASLKFRDVFSISPLYLLLDFIIFFLILGVSDKIDFILDEKYTFQVFSIALLFFVAYSIFIVWKNINDVNKEKYKNLVNDLDCAIDYKIKSNYDDSSIDKINYRERKLMFIDECSEPISKQRDFLIGIIATISATSILATLKMLISNWNTINISMGVNYLVGLYLIDFIILISGHLILCLTNLKLRILIKRALNEIKLSTI